MINYDLDHKWCYLSGIDIWELYKKYPQAIVFPFSELLVCAKLVWGKHLVGPVENNKNKTIFSKTTCASLSQSLYNSQTIFT